MDYQPSEVLAIVLTKTGFDTFRADPTQLHNVFYRLRNQNSELMKNFVFTKRTNPFSITLEKLITLFQLSGALRRTNPDYTEYQIDKTILSEFLPSDTEPFDSFKGLEVLNELAG